MTEPDLTTSTSRAGRDAAAAPGLGWPLPPAAGASTGLGWPADAPQTHDEGHA